MKKNIILISSFVLLSLVFVFGILFFSPILDVNGQSVQIQNDESVISIAQDLKSKNIIPSVFLFKVWVRINSSDKKIIPGEYVFNQSSSIFVTTKRITSADYRTDQQKIVIPEGSNVSDIATILQKTYLDFDTRGFITAVTPFEGYLFPDTYNLFVSTTTDDIIDVLKKNFDLKTNDLHNEAINENKDWTDIIIMASILEEEGKTSEDRKIIAGILYKRLEVGVALQVDSDLSTYSNIGLPPSPITNPGLESIDAAINPTETDYFYFLTGDDGKMYYAKTFEEHVANKKKYLN